MDDARYMARALELASVSEGSVSPRPPVGAVIVSTDGEVVGEGWDTPSPGPHAEIMALDAAGPRAQGATVYCTLEPCSHTGATGPCAEALVSSGVRRVVVGARDPNPAVHGRGMRLLRDAGIEVRSGVMRSACRELIRPFEKWVRTGAPFVTLKLAATLDGKVAAPDGTSRWITGPEARAEVHELRRRADAVIVGAGTISADDPSLTFRLDGVEGKQPLRVVVDSSGRTPSSARVFDGAAGVLMVTISDAPADRVEGWERAGADVARVPAAESGVDLTAMLGELGRRGVCHALCEGGPTLAGSLVEGRLVDRLIVYLAPKLLGGDAPGILGSGVKTLTDAWGVRVDRVRRVGADIRVDGILERPLEQA